MVSLDTVVTVIMDPGDWGWSGVNEKLTFKFKTINFWLVRFGCWLFQCGRRCLVGVPSVYAYCFVSFAVVIRTAFVMMIAAECYYVECLPFRLIWLEVVLFLLLFGNERVCT